MNVFKYFFRLTDVELNSGSSGRPYKHNTPTRHSDNPSFQPHQSSRPSQAYNGARPKQYSTPTESIALNELAPRSKPPRPQPHLVRASGDAGGGNVYVQTKGWRSLSDVQKVQN